MGSSLSLSKAKNKDHVIFKPPVKKKHQYTEYIYRFFFLPFLSAYLEINHFEKNLQDSAQLEPNICQLCGRQWILFYFLSLLFTLLIATEWGMSKISITLYEYVYSVCPGLPQFIVDQFIQL